MAREAWKCLIVDEMHPNLIAMLTQSGLIADYQPQIEASRIGRALAGCQVLVIRTKTRVNSELLASAHTLKLVARAGAGVDNIDAQALQERGIGLVNAPEGNRDAVGEHTLAMLLCLLNHLHTADRQVRNKVWEREPNRGTELGGKTVALIGYGHMGQSVAKRLSGFGCRVLAYDKYHPRFSEQYALRSSMEQIWREAEVVSLHIPLTPETNRMVDSAWLARFSNPIVLINTSRGEIVQQQALVEHLRQGTVKAAALDVLENEKLSQLTQQQQADFNYLASAEQVLLSPHIAGWSHESYARISTVLGTKIMEYYHSAV